MATICIIDDQIEYLNQMSDILKAFRYDLTIIKLTGYDSTIIKKYDVDLFILDIDMQGINGIDLASFIKKEFPHIDIVFVSAHNQFIHSSLIVQPIYFIRKDFLKQDFDVLFQLIDFNKYQLYITLNDIHRITRQIHLNSILYVDILNHHLTIHLDYQTFVFKLSMNDFLNKYADTNFVQIHRSYAVNINKVVYIKGDKCYIHQEKFLPIGRNYKNTFIERYKKKI